MLTQKQTEKDVRGIPLHRGHMSHVCHHFYVYEHRNEAKNIKTMVLHL